MENAIDAGIARDRIGLSPRWIAALRRTIGERQAIARLETLDDDHLRDIGMTRGTIRDAVRNGRR
jgi:uncharacterized protein YjiS (DUF1127 family)